MKSNITKLITLFIFFSSSSFASDPLVKKMWHYGITFVKIKDGTLKVKNDNITINCPVREFWMTESEISYRQYGSIMGMNSEIIRLNVTDDKQLDLPAGNISYFECIEFAKYLTKCIINDNKKITFNSGNCSLPTEIQWEFVATQSYSDLIVTKELINEFAKLSGENVFMYRPNHLKHIKYSKPNILGIYDIMGNAEEICREPFQNYYNYANLTENLAVKDVRDISVSVRGGSSIHVHTYLPSHRRSSSILFKDKNLGFRLVWEIPNK